MSGSSQSHEFSDDSLSSSLFHSSLSASLLSDESEDEDLGVDEVTQGSTSTGHVRGRISQHHSESPRWEGRQVPRLYDLSNPTSLSRHSRRSPSRATQNPPSSRTLPLLDSNSFRPLRRRRPFPTLETHTPSRDLPSSHLHLPSFNGQDDLPPISPAASQSSYDSWPGSWPSLTQSEFIDLTNDPSPPAMPPTLRAKRRVSPSIPSDGPSAAESSAKRRKTAASGKRVEKVKAEVVEPAEVDLTNVNDDISLDKVLERQQEKAIKAQREAQGDQPVRLAGLQCIICLETMTNITATHCGKFASKCSYTRLYERLIHMTQATYSAIPA